MTMKLDKSKIEPKIKEYSFFEVVPGIYSKTMDGMKYGVDFNKNEIFRLEDDNARTYKDESDTSLVWLKDMCLNAMFDKESNNVPEKEDHIIQEAGYTEVQSKEDSGSQEKEELTQEEKLKVAELVQDTGYDKETAIAVLKGEVKHESKTPATIPK
jgi:sulfur carrier protein ThiS